MVVGLFTDLVLHIALLISAAKSGWQDRRWVYPAVICAVSPWTVVLMNGLLGGSGLMRPSRLVRARLHSDRRTCALKVPGLTISS